MESERLRAIEILERSGIEDPVREVTHLLAFALGVDRMRLLAGIAPDPTPEMLDRFHHVVGERARRVPFAYITGTQDFYNHPFKVSPAVLIPRPETEELVERALKEPSLRPGNRVLDLATGSGCIAISLQCEIPGLHVIASDISEEALTIARENGRNLCEDGTGPTFIQSDFFESIPVDPKFDGIVSNPPYVHPDEMNTLSPEVLDHEPSLALFHRDPDQLYRDLLDQTRLRLKPGGFFLFEMSPRQTGPCSLYAGQFFTGVEVLKDLSGKDRFVYGRLPIP